MKNYKWKFWVFIWLLNNQASEYVETIGDKNYHYKKLFKKLFYLCCVSPVGEDE